MVNKVHGMVRSSRLLAMVVSAAVLILSAPVSVANAAAAKAQTRSTAKPTTKQTTKQTAKPKPLVKAPVKASGKAIPRQVAGKAAVNRSASRKSVVAPGGPGLRIGAARAGRKSVVKFVPAPPSFGEIYGLKSTDDELGLRSSVALVVDQETNEVLFSKNPGVVLPIASITKLMTALVVAEAALPMDELLTVGPDDVQATAGSKSRLKEGTQLTRSDMLHLSLMASENRAAHVLGRTYPGGMPRFVNAMNGKAQLLGMSSTRYVEPTGLSSSNQSSAQDLTRLVRAAFLHPIIRELSTSLEMVVAMGEKSVQFRNSNGLVHNPDWDIGLQKTGYISAAGRCVVMQAQLAGRKLILVLLDSAGKYSRMGDAERLRRWLADSGLAVAAGSSAPSLAAQPLQPR